MGHGVGTGVGYGVGAAVGDGVGLCTHPYLPAFNPHHPPTKLRSILAPSRPTAYASAALEGQTPSIVALAHLGVRLRLGAGVGSGVGAGVGLAVGDGVGSRVGDSEGAGVGDGVGLKKTTPTKHADGSRTVIL